MPNKQVATPRTHSGQFRFMPCLRSRVLIPPGAASVLPYMVLPFYLRTGKATRQLGARIMPLVQRRSRRKSGRSVLSAASNGLMISVLRNARNYLYKSHPYHLLSIPEIVHMTCTFIYLVLCNSPS